jgi:hypothetical protein
MELIMNKANPEILDIEELLAVAGIEFTVVAACPHPQCEICNADDLSVAA